MSLSKELFIKANVTLVSGVLLWAFYKWLQQRKKQNATLENENLNLTKDEINLKILYGSVTGKSKVN